MDASGPGPTPTHPAHALGRWGEALAARRLEAGGWRILERNYRFGRREVDLVVVREGVLAFVEVKTRAGEGYGSPLEAITWRKRLEIEAVAAHYLATRRPRADAVRFDAVAVTRDRGGRARVEHVEGAWRPRGWSER